MTADTALRLPTLLVTGAGGFVMQNCIPVWLGLGYRVIALDTTFDPKLKRDWEQQGDIQFIGASVQNAISNDLLPDVDAVVHAAAITAAPSRMGLTPEAHLRANLNPGLSLLEWSAEHHVRRVVLVSSSAVYVETDGIVTEDQPVTPENTYAIAKAAFEAMATYYGETEYQRSVIAVRLGNVYGVDETARESRPNISMIGKFINRAVSSNSVSIPTPDQLDKRAAEWTFAPDIGKAIHALLQTPSLPHPLYQVASEQWVTRRAIFEVLQQRFPNLEVFGIDYHDELLQSKRGILSHARLEADTGFHDWTPLEVGLLQVVDYALAAKGIVQETAR